MLLCRNSFIIMYRDINLNVSFCIYYVLFVFFKIDASTNLVDSFAKNKSGVSRNVIPRIKTYICIDIQPQHHFHREYNMNSSGYFDTITHDDIVRKRYTLLPYPKVTKNEIQDMKLHYDGELRNIPFTAYPAITLENINHFLYRGSNHFR